MINGPLLGAVLFLSASGGLAADGGQWRRRNRNDAIGGRGRARVQQIKLDFTTGGVATAGGQPRGIQFVGPSARRWPFSFSVPSILEMVRSITGRCDRRPSGRRRPRPADPVARLSAAPFSLFPFFLFCRGENAPYRFRRHPTFISVSEWPFLLIRFDRQSTCPCTMNVRRSTGFTRRNVEVSCRTPQFVCSPHL